MRKVQLSFVAAAAAFLFICFFIGPVRAQAGALKEGMKGSSVTSLQKKLIKTGFLNTNATGFYGSATAAAVTKLQKKYRYSSDGIAGTKTLNLLDKLTNAGTSKTSTVKTSSSKAGSVQAIKSKTTSTSSKSYAKSWSVSSRIFTDGTVATVYDIASGKSFRVKRTYGHNHADCETVSSKDTATMKNIFGGWNWDRRAVVITVGKTKIAASMAGMPHAGIESASADRYIRSRSGGFGSGRNYDAVKGNKMSGHFDIHFLGSRTHGTNRVDSKHQAMVKKAAEWAKKNL